jgi:hypothetical protein
MTMEIAAAAALGQAAQAGGQAAGAAGGAAAPGQVGYGVSLTDIAGFEHALAGAGARLETRPIAATSETAKQLMKPFDHINVEATKLSADASAAQAAGIEMTPGEIVMLTVRSQEFMFHCQLTSNIANRASDGLQQLFRQQA